MTLCRIRIFKAVAIGVCLICFVFYIWKKYRSILLISENAVQGRWWAVNLIFTSGPRHGHSIFELVLNILISIKNDIVYLSLSLVNLVTIFIANFYAKDDSKSVWLVTVVCIICSIVMMSMLRSWFSFLNKNDVENRSVMKAKGKGIVTENRPDTPWWSWFPWQSRVQCQAGSSDCSAKAAGNKRLSKSKSKGQTIENSRDSSWWSLLPWQTGVQGQTGHLDGSAKSADNSSFWNWITVGRGGSYGNNSASWFSFWSAKSGTSRNHDNHRHGNNSCEPSKTKGSKSLWKWCKLIFWIGIFLTFVWEFIRLYQLEQAEQLALQTEGMPIECQPEKMSYIHKTWTWFVKQASWDDDPCLKYMKKMTVDTVWNVSPLKVIVSSLVSYCLVYPAQIIVEGAATGMRMFFSKIPTQYHTLFMIVAIFFIIIIFIAVVLLCALVLVMCCGYQIHTPFFKLEPKTPESSIKKQKEKEMRTKKEK